MTKIDNSNIQTELHNLLSILKISKNIEILNLQGKLKHLEEVDTNVLCEQLKNDIDNGLCVTTKDIILRLNETQ